MLKSSKLHNWGAKKVFWILTATQQVVVAEAGKDWIIRDWNKSIELLPDYEINIGTGISQESGLDIV